MFVCFFLLITSAAFWINNLEVQSCHHIPPMTTVCFYVQHECACKHSYLCAVHSGIHWFHWLDDGVQVVTSGGSHWPCFPTLTFAPSCRLAAVSSLSPRPPSKMSLLSRSPWTHFTSELHSPATLSSQVKLLPNNLDALPPIPRVWKDGREIFTKTSSLPVNVRVCVHGLSFVALTFISFASQILLITPVRNQ